MTRSSTSTRYDFGLCSVAYLGRSPIEDVSIRFSQSVEGRDEAMLRLTQFEARDLARQILDLIGDDE